MKMTRPGRAVAQALALLISVAAAGPALAQAFPGSDKPITIIVPYAPGGVTDTSARLMAAGLEKELKVSVQVANKAGAASQVGLSELARSAPDGHTLAYAVLPTVTTHYLDPSRQAVYTRVNFQPVGLHLFSPAVLAVRSDGPFKTLKDLVEAARAKPGTIKISDSGLMAVPHLQVLMLEQAAGVRFASVHFTGGAPSVTALLGGHVDVLAGGSADALAHMKAGTFRVLGIADTVADPGMPDVPTMASQGYDVQAASWTGIVAPAGTPQAAVQTLTAAMRKVIEEPAHSAKLLDLGINPRYLAPDDYTKVWIGIENRMKPILESLKK